MNAAAQSMPLGSTLTTHLGTYDVIVAGVGGMGSAACWHLARRGQRVLGLERYDIPNTMGSSHGVNRIIRLAYFEHPSYVPLLRRAYALWRETEQLYGEQLLYVTGSLDIGPPDSRNITGSLESCIEHNLDHEVLEPKDINRRFPGYRVGDGAVGVLQPDGGFVASERAIAAHASLAMAAGAEIHGCEPMLGYDVSGSGGVRVTTNRGTYEARRLILSTGAWIGDHVPHLSGKAVPERQVLGWFQPKVPEHYRLGRFPVSNWLTDIGHFYQFPVWHVPGFKIGLYHHLSETGRADELPRQVTQKDEEVLRAGISRYFPDANGPILSLRVCHFTNTPDEHFVIDTVPGAPSIIMASPCSGHGFKFASVMGEVLADLAMERQSKFDLSLFGLRRLLDNASSE
jgi:sarcosine oxidase